MLARAVLLILFSLGHLEPHFLSMAYAQDEYLLEVVGYRGYGCRRLSSCLLDRAMEVPLEDSRESTHGELQEKGETRQWTSWLGFRIDRMLVRGCPNRRIWHCVAELLSARTAMAVALDGVHIGHCIQDAPSLISDVIRGKSVVRGSYPLVSVWLERMEVIEYIRWQKRRCLINLVQEGR